MEGEIMASTTNLKHTCGECTFRNHTYCVKSRMNVRPAQYACAYFMTDEEYKAEREAAKEAAYKKNEMRFNFLLTALEISATSTQQIMEYFDSLFTDHMVERDWRRERKQAANEIRKCAARMRNLFQQTYMVDQMNVMTGHGEREFDCTAWDSHEMDGRMAVLKLLYDLDRCWQDPSKDKEIIDHYKSMPSIGAFEQMDFNHFDR